MFRNLFTVVTLAFAVFAAPAMADEYEDTIASFRAADETAPFFANAHGYVVFPTIGKGGIGLGFCACLHIPLWFAHIYSFILLCVT